MYSNLLFSYKIRVLYFLHRQTERYFGPPYNNIFLIVFLLLIYKNSIFTVMRFEETVVQVCSPVLMGSFSFDAEKSELESSSSELLCFDVCHHFGKCGFIYEPLTSNCRYPCEGLGVGAEG